MVGASRRVPAIARWDARDGTSPIFEKVGSRSRGRRVVRISVSSVPCVPQGDPTPPTDRTALAVHNPVDFPDSSVERPRQSSVLPVLLSPLLVRLEELTLRDARTRRKDAHLGNEGSDLVLLFAVGPRRLRNVGWWCEPTRAATARLPLEAALERPRQDSGELLSQLLERLPHAAPAGGSQRG